MNQHSAVPQTDPRAAYTAHKAEIDSAIASVLESGQYILGREVSTFEQEFAAHIGVRHAIGVANGTDALEIALRACGIGAGDTVFTVSHTAVATVSAIERCGAIPCLVDIDLSTYAMDPNHLEDMVKASQRGSLSISGCPKAIIPVHLYGHPADLPAILNIAQRYNLTVIEDCAQAHDAMIHGRKTGSWGRLSAFSFYPTKNLGALGDGGMVLTDDQELAERVRSLREYGWRDRYISRESGINSRLDELQAAVLRVKLRYLALENSRRREIAKAYDKLFSDTSLILPEPAPSCLHVYHQYVIRTDERDGLRAYLSARQVGSSIHYPVPVHLQPAYQGRLPETLLPRTEQVARQILSLPMYPQLREDQVHATAQCILSWGKPESLPTSPSMRQ